MTRLSCSVSQSGRTYSLFILMLLGCFRCDYVFAGHFEPGDDCPLRVAQAALSPAAIVPEYHPSAAILLADYIAWPSNYPYQTDSDGALFHTLGNLELLQGIIQAGNKVVLLTSFEKLPIVIAVADALGREHFQFIPIDNYIRADPYPLTKIFQTAVAEYKRVNRLQGGRLTKQEVDYVPQFDALFTHYIS